MKSCCKYPLLHSRLRYASLAESCINFCVRANVFCTSQFCTCICCTNHRHKSDHTVVSFACAGVETVTSVSPSTGPSTGGTVVRVRGSGFLNVAELSCSFGATIVPAKWQSSIFVQCVSPSKSPGTQLTVKVSNNGADFSSTFTIFEYQGKTQAQSLLLLWCYSCSKNTFLSFFRQIHNASKK
jgi:hypothetical protein